MQENKKIWLGIIALLVAVIGATYAFYDVQGDTVATGGKRVTASTTDSLAFEKGNDISLNLNQYNFNKTKGSSSGETYVKAILTANNKTNTATNNYNIYIDISENGIDYTTTDKKPELVLTVTDKDNNPVTIEGLKPVNVTDRTNTVITGYDITNVNGLIKILDNKEIVVDESNTEHTTIDKYNIKITMVNLDTDQSANTGKIFTSQIIIQKDEIDIQLAEYITSRYTSDGANGLYYHDGTGTYGEYEVGDNSYRYTGANPNNYICLGSSEETCPEDNLYRIIGVFGDKTKIIKKTKLSSDMAWDSNNSNTWTTSSLKTYLNGTYYNGLDATSQGLIVDSTWKVGGNNYSKLEIKDGVKNVYAYEITNSGIGGDNPPTDGITEDTFKVGLMYVTDYMYAADPTQKDAWSALRGYNSSDETKDFRAVTDSNWLYSGNFEWTITRLANYTDRTVNIHETGRVSSDGVDSLIALRPSFYLDKSTKVLSGNGSLEKPIRITK